MKIIIVGPAYPFRGGIADTNESFCRSLNKIGHDAEIITFTVQYPSFLFPGKTQFTTSPKPEGIKISRLINSINPLSWFKTARAINKKKPDLVIVRYWMPFLSPCLGMIARLLNKKIKKLAFCDNVIPHEKRFGDQSFTSYFLKPFDGFITLSNTVRKEILQFSDKKTLYQPHPINDNLGDIIEMSKAKSHLGLDENKDYILFFGLVRKYKGLDLLLEAMADSRIKELSIELLIAGEFYDPIEEYESLIDRLDLADKIKIENKFIPLEDIKYYFSASGLIAQTYRSASQSGVTQIAFNFEKPTLVTNVGGLAEIITNGYNGYVTENDPKSIADGILEYYKQRKSIDFRANVHNEKKKYSWVAFSEKIIDFINGA